MTSGHTATISTEAAERELTARLQETLRKMEEKREQVMNLRRRRLTLIGGSVSLVFHLLLLVYLSTLHMASGSSGAGADSVIEFAILNEDELDDSQATDFDEMEFEGEPIEEVPIEFPELSPVFSDVDLTAITPGSLPVLTTSQDESSADFSLSGGGGGASFFGVSSKGTRIAYIVDVSGSMATDRKLEVAMRELARSIDNLPDYAHFYIALFSNDYVLPPMQRGWTVARKNTVRNVIRWLGSVEPNGGTQPRTAFQQVFSLEVRPDVVFFMTDGEIQDFTAQELVAINSRGRKSVINTIAFGDPSSQELLKTIARESGGVYRFVPAEGP